MKKIKLTGSNLSIKLLKKISLETKITIHKESLLELEKDNNILKNLAKDGLKIYGYNYGVGSDIDNKVFDNKKFNKDQVYATASGLDYSLDPICCKIITIIRINELLAKGSTIRPILVNKIVKLLNKDIIPCYPKKGSVSIGDICLMSHLSLFLMGDGYCYHKTRRTLTKKIFKNKKIKKNILIENEALNIMSSNAYTKYFLINNYLKFKRELNFTEKNFKKSFLLIDGNNLMHTKTASQNLNINLKYKNKVVNKIQDPLSFRTFPIKLKLSKKNLKKVKKELNKSLNTCDTNPSIFELKEKLNVKNISNKSVFPTLGFDLLKISLIFEEMESLINHIAKSQYYIIEKLLDPKYNKNTRYISNKKNDFGVGYITRVVGQSLNEIIQDNSYSFQYIASEEMVEDFSTNTLSISNCINLKLTNLSDINLINHFINYLLDSENNSYKDIFKKDEYFSISLVLEEIKNRINNNLD